MLEETRVGNLLHEMFLMLTTGSLRKIRTEASLADPEDMLRRLVPAQFLANPISHVLVLRLGTVRS
jgi:hypothetical protein